MPINRTLKVLDLFAGCGGLSLGLEQAGFRTLAFAEINADAADTFEANLKRPGMLRFGDVRADLKNAALQGLRSEWGAIDLICGGPPCQGFSGIGHRRSYSVQKEALPSNHLYKEMVRIIRQLEPRMFLFENVRGLLAGRWTEHGEKGEIWNDVRASFRSLKQYEVGWQVVQAKDFGVPQNRPRVLLLGVHRDLGVRLEPDRPDDVLMNPRGLLPCRKVTPPDLVDVLSDLDDPDFASKPATEHYLCAPKSKFQRQMRKDRWGTKVLGAGARLTEQEYTRHSEQVTERFRRMIENGGEIPHELKTKKFAQRLLPARWDPMIGPTITATSLPDDFVHYNRPRILTVREWARLQMFPDWFEFRGPRTTGGHRRAGIPTKGVWEREVPKYTQIGNAVPVGLAAAVGAHLATLLGAKRSRDGHA